MTMFGHEESDVLSECHILDNLTYQGFSRIWFYVDEKCHSEYTQKIHIYERTLYIEENMFTMSYNMDFKKLHSPMMISSPCQTLHCKFYCLLMKFVDVGYSHLVQFIHKRLCLINEHLQLKFPNSVPLHNLIVIVTYS